MGASMKKKQWIFRLYIAGMTPVAEKALANIETIANEYLAGAYEIDVVDLREEPTRADADKIIIVPTLVRLKPLPIRKVIGDLASKAQVLAAFDLDIS
jgi:circadian clock protein KaiB